MKKRTKRIIVAAVVVVVVAAGVVTYSMVTANAAQAAKFSAVYGTDVATKGSITLTVSGSGNLASSKTVTVAAPGHLDIANVLVTTGDTIKAGQPIATLNISAMQTYADSLQQQITADENSIDTTNSAPTKFNITSPVDGWVKNIVVGTKSSNDSIGDAMNKYGYVALVSTEEKEIISAAGSSLAAGDVVTVKCQRHTFKGTVVKETGGLYVRIDTKRRTIGADAVVYDKSGNKLFTGQIELEAYQPIVSSYGTVTDVKVSENSAVSAGDTLFTAEQYSLAVKNLYDNLSILQPEYQATEELIKAGQITASDSGIIDTMNMVNGSTYEEGTALMTLDSPDNWIASVTVDELDVNSIKIGQSASVTLDSMPGQTFNGKVVRISDKGTASGGITTYEVDVSLDSNSSFKIGMSATCEITSQQATNVVIVPVTDVKTINSQNYVMVEVSRTDAEKDEIRQMITANDYAGLSKYMGVDAATLGITRLTDPIQLLYSEVREVKIGIQNASFMEIKNGLNIGDKILAQTTTNSSNSNRNFPIGGFGGLPGGIPGGFTQRTGGSTANRGD